MLCLLYDKIECSKKNTSTYLWSRILFNGGVESLLKYTVYLRIKYVQLYLTVYFKFQRHIFQRIQEKSTLVFSLLCVIMENNFIF